MKKIIIIAVVFMLVGVSFISTANSIAIKKENKGQDNIHTLDAPTVWAELDPPEPNGKNGWYVSRVKVSLFAEDDQVGVEDIYYRFGTPWQTYAGPFIVSASGVHFLEFFAIDKVGNPSKIESVYFQIDMSPPDIELTKNVTSHSEIIFTAKCYDCLSETDYVELYVDEELYSTKKTPMRVEFYDAIKYYEFKWTGAGNHTVKAIAYDYVGNKGESNELTTQRNKIKNNLLFDLLQRQTIIKNILKFNHKNFWKE